MIEEVHRRWGMFTIAVVMCVLHILVAEKGGALWAVFWGFLAYSSYRGNLVAIAQYLKIALVINVAMFAVVALIVDADSSFWIATGWAGIAVLAVAAGISIAIMGGMLWYVSSISQPQILSFGAESPSRASSRPQRANATTSQGAKSRRNDSNLYKATDSDEQLWEQALQECDSAARKQGLWAKHYSMHGGDEKKVKAAYLEERVQQLAAQQEQLRLDQLRKSKEESTAEYLLQAGHYQSTTVGDCECLIIANGEAAIKRESKYLLYKNEQLMRNSALYHEATGTFRWTGMLRKIPVPKTNFENLTGEWGQNQGSNGFSTADEGNNDSSQTSGPTKQAVKKRVITCPTCKQKCRIPVAEELLQVTCPSCNLNWIAKPPNTRQPR